MKLFVYGSLKPGGWSHHLLEGKVEEDPLEGTIRGSLYDAGAFPALKMDDEGEVHGLIYNIKEKEHTSLMRRLDSLEGYPRLYDRAEVPVLTDNDVEYAIVYFGKQESLFDGPRIDSGIWEV